MTSERHRWFFQRQVKDRTDRIPCRAKSRRRNRISLSLTPIRNHPLRFRLVQQEAPGLPLSLGPCREVKSEDLRLGFSIIQGRVKVSREVTELIAMVGSRCFNPIAAT